MKTVVLNGSPRKDGNTAKLLKKATEEHANVDLKYFDLVDMKIKPCMGCMYCKSHELCSINDDMNKVYKAIKEADAVILGSPIYMGAETAWLKGALDRLYATVAKNPAGPGFTPKFNPPKKAVAIFTCGNPQGDKIYSNLSDRYFQFFSMTGCKDIKTYIIPGMVPGSDVMEHVAAQRSVNEVKAMLE